jgi:hypothetical protein
LFRSEISESPQDSCKTPPTPAPTPSGLTFFRDELLELKDFMSLLTSDSFVFGDKMLVITICTAKDKGALNTAAIMATTKIRFMSPDIGRKEQNPPRDDVMVDVTLVDQTQRFSF